MKMTNTLLSAFLLMLLMTGMSLASTATVSYTYDDAGRLIQAGYGEDRAIVYTYDANGNLIRREVQGGGSGYTLTTAASPAGSGTVTKDPDQATYDHGTDVEMTAEAEVEWRFLGWSGDLTGTTNPDSISMNANKTVTAYFGAQSGDTSGNGLSDETQMGPDGNDPSYDGDGNGVPDYQEARAASLPTFAGGGYVTLGVPEGQALTNVEAVAPSTGAPDNVQFPYGLFSFKIIGLIEDCTTATLYLPRNTAINTYYKYGRTPENQTDHWYEFRHNGQTGAEISHTASRTMITLHLCDGQPGDHDLTANGEIIDPGGPGIRRGDPAAIPTLSQWGLVVLCVLMLGAFPWMRRRHGGWAS